MDIACLGVTTHDLEIANWLRSSHKRFPRIQRRKFCETRHAALRGRDLRQAHTQADGSSNLDLRPNPVVPRPSLVPADLYLKLIVLVKYIRSKKLHYFLDTFPIYANWPGYP